MGTCTLGRWYKTQRGGWKVEFGGEQYCEHVDEIRD